VPSVNGMTRNLRRLGQETQYALLGFPLGLITLVLALTGFLLGLGTVIIWIGLPILLGTLMLSRGFAVVERNRVAAVLGHRLPQPQYKHAPGRSFVRRMLTPMTDTQSWLDLVHGIFRWIPSTIAFAFVVAWWSVALSGLTFPLWDWSIPRGPDNTDLPELIGLGDAQSTRVIFYLGVGAFFALTLIPVVRAVAGLEAAFARVLLSGVTELREQVAEAQAQTAAAVSAEATALRRLERDIHDGPQQRLVRLAMDLGRAEQQFGTDPEAARATVAEALTQTRETLNELRALSRGIAPPILVDRGLPAALTALAGRCPIPVDLDVAAGPRLTPAVESTAYFVVAEALTNVAKHSRASQCVIHVHQLGASLFVTVIDDGAGGASLAKGHGLAGLDDRVRAAGGLLTLESFDGAGTKLTAALPV
jgi:signal transduction histidine kinase